MTGALVDATGEIRSALLARNLMANLSAIDEFPHASEVDYYGPDQVTIASAGPSLFVDLPENARKRDVGQIWATQASALALRANGWAPDVVCCVESIDLSDQIERGLGAAFLILDLTASPAAWALARRVAPRRTAWILAWTPDVRAVLDHPGILPSSGGASSLTAAASVALGLPEVYQVYLAGVTLSVPPGRSNAYAPGAHWDGMTVTVDETGFAEYAGALQREGYHGRAGIQSPPRLRQLLRACDGGWIAGEYELQAKILNRLAERSQAVCYRGLGCYEGLTSWCEPPGQVFFADPRDRHVPPSRIEPPRPRSAQVRERWIRESSEVLARASAIEHAMPVALGEPTLANLLAAPDVLRARRSGLSERDRVRVVYGAFAEAASEIIRTLST